MYARSHSTKHNDSIQPLFLGVKICPGCAVRSVDGLSCHVYIFLARTHNSRCGTVNYDCADEDHKLFFGARIRQCISMKLIGGKASSIMDVLRFRTWSKLQLFMHGGTSEQGLRHRIFTYHAKHPFDY
jgi:hypothetical protein